MPDRINLKIRMEDRAFWGTVEEFPGVFATGDSLDELRVTLEEGIALYVAKQGEDVRPVQLPPLEPADTVASAELAFVSDRERAPGDPARPQRISRTTEPTVIGYRHRA